MDFCTERPGKQFHHEFAKQTPLAPKSVPMATLRSDFCFHSTRQNR